MLLPLAWGCEADFPLLVLIAGSLRTQNNIVSVILWPKDGISVKNILPRVKSLSGSVCGKLLSNDNKFLLAQRERIMAIKSKEDRVSQTRQGPVWPEGSPWYQVGSSPAWGRSGRMSWSHTVHTLLDTLPRFSLVCCVLTFAMS